MTLAGERIQALFSELTLEDQNIAPSFGNVWQRAELRAADSSRNSIRSLAVVAATVVVIAVLSLMMWTSSENNLPERSLVSVPLPEPAPVPAVVRKSTDATSKLSKVWRRTNRSSVRRREAFAREASMLRNAALMSSWRSPTETLLESPAGSVLKSVPKLNEAVKDLESFLPNNEVKELNR
jgi:hypothetical protein